MPRREGIALCLSGGGFRSALFHLGASRRLSELGLLHEVALISSVSGGSIFSGFLADRLAAAGGIETALDFAGWLDDIDWERDISAPFREITSHDFRTVPVLKNLPWNWIAPGFRVRDLERRYRRRISTRKLAELPAWPSFVFCATSMTFGVNWEFTRGESGDYQGGYVAGASGWPLARAVAASSCFPPIFGPLRIRARPESYRRGSYRGDDRDALLAKTALTDGGVYDNMGLEPAWKEYGTVLVSDCGAPFGFTFGSSPIRRILRYTSVVMNQAASVRKRLYFDQIRRGDYVGTYWGIRSAAWKSPEDDEVSVVTYPGEGALFQGYRRELVDSKIAAIRTDLDAFTEAEQKILENHGYYAANHSVNRYLRAPLPRESPPRPPHPDWLDEARVARALRTSASRISIRRSFQVLLDRRRRRA